MRHVILSLSFCFICTGELCAQYVLSPRVGDVIDKNEREYFGLFPTVAGFVSATTSLEQDQQVRFVIARAENGVTGDTTFTIRPTVVNYLVRYIESFETVRGRTNKVSWDFLEGLAASGPVIENKLGDGNETTVLMRNGEQLHGKLLYADDSALVLWQSQEQYNWRTLELFGRKVHPSNVEHITIEHDGHIGGGLGYGALIGTVPLLILGLIVSQAADDCGHCGIPGGPGVVVVAGLIGASGGAIIGGTIGAIQDIDADREVGGSIEKYHKILPFLSEKAIFTSAPPPELEQIKNVSASDNTLLSGTVNQLIEEATPSNAFYVELGGNSDGISVNYEWRFATDFSARIGAGLSNGTQEISMALAMPILVYYFFSLGSGHNIQLGGGVLVRTDEPSACATVSIGYRYQPKHSGFIFEAGFTPNLYYTQAFPFGLGVGYAF